MNPRKLSALPPSLALLAIVAIIFSPAFFKGKILAPLDITATLLPPWNETANGEKPHNHFPSDAVTQYLPYRIFAEKSLREDGYIGWNPYEMGGYSLAANTMALPGSWPMQLHRWLPFKDAWNLGIIGEFLIAGIGMLVFLRSRKLPWLPCLIGAVAFMFNAQFIIWIYHRWALGSFCWMPWVLWAYGNGFSYRPFPRRTFLLPIFLALALLGGSIQHVVFVVLACGCIAAADFHFRRPLANTTPLLAWSAAFVLAISIAAFSLVPQFQAYLSNLAVGHTRGGIGYPGGVSQVFYHILLIPCRIWPWLGGDPQSMDAWKLLKSDFMALNYIGTIPMLLGFAGLFVAKMPRQAKWLILVGLIIPLTPLVGPLYHRVELLFILGATWMTAEMLTYLPLKRNGFNASTAPHTRVPVESEFNPVQHTFFQRNFTWRRILIASVSALGITLVLASMIPTGLREKVEAAVVSKALARSSESQFGSDRDWIASRTEEWTRRFSIAHPKTAFVYGLLVVGSAGLLLASKDRRKSVMAGQLLVLAATSFELATLFHSWTTWSSPDDLKRSVPALERIRSFAGENRVLQSYQTPSFGETFATPNLLASHSIPSIDAYESIQYRSPLEALTDEPAGTRLSLANVALAVYPKGGKAPAGTESWVESTLSLRYLIRRNPTVAPVVSAGYSTRPEDPQQILRALSAPVTVTSFDQTSNRRSLTLPKDAKWLRISQNWHAGWKWRIRDGSWHPFINGSDAACWIDDIPPNTRHIDIQFFPRSKWLIYLSIAAALASCAFFLVLPRGLLRAKVS